MSPSPNIASNVARTLSERDGGAVVSDVRIGLGYTGVMLDDGRAGVAYTFREEAKGGCSVFRKFRPVSGRHSSELVALLESDDPIEAAVGLACANSLVNVEDAEFQNGDVLKHLDLRVERSCRNGGALRPTRRSPRGKSEDSDCFRENRDNHPASFDPPRKQQRSFPDAKSH